MEDVDGEESGSHFREYPQDAKGCRLKDLIQVAGCRGREVEESVTTF